MKKFLLMLLAAFFISGVVLGQLSGNKSIPGDYATIEAAVSALNTQGVGGGGVTFNVAVGHTETVTAPILLTATGTATDPIVFQKSGVGANPLITRSDTGTLVTTTLGAQGDAVIIIEGSDYVTFDGISVTATAPGIEYGYYLRKASVTDACKSPTIKNAVITMNKGTRGTIAGIYSSNNDATSTVSSATGITVTSTGGRVENLVITGNTISNVFAGIVLRGYNQSSTYDFYDQNVVVGTAGHGNTISNFAGNNTGSAYGVYLIYQTSPTISYNTIDNKGGGGSDATGTLYGIFMSSSSLGGNFVANNNNITLNQGATGGAHCIYNGQTCTSITINNNTFGFGTFASTTTSYLIYCSNSTPNITIDGNVTTGTINKTGAGLLYGYYNYGSPSAGTATINNNNFSSITLTGASEFYGIRHYTSTSQAAVITNNTVSNITAGTSAIYGIYEGYGAANSNVSNNYVFNLNNPNASSTTAIYGIYLGASTAPVSLTAYGNTVYGLSNAGSGTVYGIYNNVGTATSIYKNKVSALTNTNAAGAAHGIYISGGALTHIYNNVVSDITAPIANAANPVNGIYIGGGTTVNVFYNTVYLNASSTGTLFGSSALYASTTPTVDLRNNILVNASTPSGTGITAAYRRSSSTLTTYSANSNNNCFYAGNPEDATHAIFYDGTTTYNMAGYLTLVGPRDASSFRELPPFINVATKPYNLHISTTTPTYCMSGGITITTPITITDDIDGDLRAPTPCTGADEFAGIAGGVVNPGSFAVTSINSQQIDISFVPNASSNNVVLVWNATGTFETPTGTPVVGNPLAGGTVLYIGVSSPVHHTGLTPATPYYYKAFSYNGTNYSTGVSGSATPGVNPATGFTATTFSTTQINLGWTLNTSGHNVVIATNSTATFGDPVNGAALNVGDPITGGGTVIYKGTLAAFQHTGLTPGTPYYYKIWSVDPYVYYSTGATANAATFCNIVSTYPFNEGFETGFTDQTAVAGCYTQQIVTGSYNWMANSSLTSYNRTPHSGTFNAYLHWSADTWLFRQFHLTAGQSYTFDIYARQDVTTGANLEVKYGTTGTAAGMTETIIASTVIINGDYQYLTGVFTPATTGDYFIGIHGVLTSTPYYLSIDDIALYHTPSCVAPNNLTAEATSMTEVNIGWTSSGSAWEYQYGAAGYTPTPAGTATTVNPVHLTGLSPFTEYDFYVRTNCTTSFSDWSGPKTFSIDYCTPAPTSVDDNGITNVTFGTIDNTPPVLPVPGNYGNYSNLVTDVNQNSTVPIAITFETGYTYNTMIWIDWNNDLDFTDPGDSVYSGTSTSASPTTLEGSFDIPAGAPLGNHRLRIGAADSDFPDPCYTGSYGVFHDYTINVVEPLPAGTLQGHVYDPSGEEVIDHATVTVSTFSTETDVNGFYQIQNIPVGTYDVTCSKTGYQPGTATGVAITQNQTTTRNFNLQYQLDPPKGLQAEVQNQYNTYLTWLAPGYEPDQWIFWDNGTNLYGIGSASAGTFSAVVRFAASDISKYAGKELSKISFYATSYAGLSWTLKVWEGAEPPTEIYSQPLTGITASSWNEVTLTTPINISGTQDLWFGYELSYGAAMYPAGCDDGTAYVSNKNFLYEAGTWYEMGSEAGLPYNWNIHGWVSDPSAGPESPLIPITETKPAGDPTTPLQLSKVVTNGLEGYLGDVYPFQPGINLPAGSGINNDHQPLGSAWPVTGYNIYRGATKLNATPVANQYYTDAGLAPGTYSYTVKAVYPMGESPEAAGPVEVTIYSCDVPTNLQVPMATVTKTSAVANWTPSVNTPVAHWTVEYGLKNFVQGTGTIVDVTTNPTCTMSNLTAGTEYDVYVRTVCGQTDFSLWIKKTFRTRYIDCPQGATAELEVCGDTTNNGCNLTIPTFEPISCGTTICGTAWYNGGSRDTDWYTFTLNETTDVTVAGNADFSHIFGFIASPCPATAFIDAVTGNPGEASSLTIQLAAGTYYVFAAPLFAEHVLCDSLNKYYVTLTCNTNCIMPSNLNATIINGTTVDLGWTSAGTLFNVEWGLNGFVKGTGTLVPGVPNPYRLTGLTGSTSYDYYVQTDCGSNTLSAWAGPFTFATPCETAPAPWSEGFEGDIFFPTCWSGTTVSPYWVRSTACSGYGIGTASAKAGFYGYSSGSFDLITMLFDPTTVSGPLLKFDYAYATYSGELDELDIYYSVDGGNTYTLLLPMVGGTSGILNTAGTTTSAFVPTANQWATQEIPLPAGTNMVKFTGVSDYGNNLYIDNVRIEATPVPENLTVQNETVSGENCYNATQTITVAGGETTFLVEATGSATFIAGQNILFMPGTKVLAGGYLHGYIAPGGPFCGEAANTMVTKTVEAVEETPAIQSGEFFTVYPNPTNDKFYLELDPSYRDANIIVNIYGMVGGLVQKEQLTGNNRYEFSLSGKNTGVYFIRVMAGDRIDTKKVIKK